MISNHGIYLLAAYGVTLALLVIEVGILLGRKREAHARRRSQRPPDEA